MCYTVSMKFPEAKETPISQIKPYNNNPRKNQKAVDAVAESIRTFGFIQPVVVDKTSEIVIGHTRILAALQLNMTSVPVIKLDNLTDAQVKALRLADNKVGEISQWDWNKLDKELAELADMDFFMGDLGFPQAIMPDFEDTEEIKKLEEEASKKKSQDIKQGDVIDLESGTLFVGTPSDFDVDLIDIKANLVITEGDVEKSYGLISENASFYSLTKPDTLPVKQELILVTPQGLEKTDYQHNWQTIYYGWTGENHYFTFDNSQSEIFDIEKDVLMKLKKNELVKMLLNPQTDVIRSNEKGVPMDVIARWVGNSSKPNQTVVDPDCTEMSSKTARACNKMNRVFIGFCYDIATAKKIIKEN